MGNGTSTIQQDGGEICAKGARAKRFKRLTFPIFVIVIASLQVLSGHGHHPVT